MQINYISRQNIDIEKWDRCIAQATNGLIYAESFYLDHMARHWDALVMNDYACVMPVTWNRKYGVYYLYQPFLCASLGVFGNRLDASLLTRFLNAIPSRFKFWDIYLNPGNNFECPGFPFSGRSDYVLELNAPYEQLLNNYRTSYRQLLKRFDHLGYQVQRDVDIDDVINLAKEQLNPLFNVKQEDYERFAALFSFLKSRAQAKSYGVYDGGRQLLASGLFVFSKGRAYYMLAGNHPNGRTLGASHAMLNAFISDHAGSRLVLDFEGSDVSQIAFFFKGFGATEIHYPGLRLNRLPALMRWLKN